MNATFTHRAGCFVYFRRTTSRGWVGLSGLASANESWPNRDPLEEGGDKNLYRFARNSPFLFADRWGLSTISVNVAFDRTFDYGEDMKYWDGQKDFMRDALKECCTKLQIGCGNDLEFVEDWIGFGKEHDGRTNPGKDTIVVTTGPLPGGAAGLGWPGGGGYVNPRNQKSVLAHECGHMGGCSYPRNSRDPKHDTNPGNIMARASNTGIDVCWCKSVNSLAK